MLRLYLIGGCTSIHLASRSIDMLLYLCCGEFWFIGSAQSKLLVLWVSIYIASVKSILVAQQYIARNSMFFI